MVRKKAKENFIWIIDFASLGIGKMISWKASESFITNQA